MVEFGNAWSAVDSQSFGPTFMEGCEEALTNGVLVLQKKQSVTDLVNFPQ